MKINLTPIAAAMFILLMEPTYAAGGATGQNGASSIGGLIGGESVGDPGGTADGKDGGLIANPSPIVLESKVVTGQPGNAGGDSSTGGGGGGGNGGASVIGTLSIGGAGGYSDHSNDNLSAIANGGTGGNALNIQITLDNVTLNGSNAAGGQGGNASSQGGAGGGGHAGGSVFGGISIGGAGGYTNSTYAYATSYANGGDGGDISAVTISISNSSALIGSGGGQGGDASKGGAGRGGHAGGSVFGAISTGGSGGDSTSNNHAIANGGAGGNFWDVQITLNNVTLDGSNTAGGHGGNTVQGGAGDGGHAGGSVFGGISSGGAGGSSSFLQQKHNSFAVGGSGSSFSRIQISLDNVTLNGSNTAGGQGGNASSYGGAGAGGHAGGSVFGGISTGGAGGYAISNDDSIYTTDAGGGNGGRISNAQITLNNVTLNGSSAAGGQGGNAASGGAGIQGYDGGSVFGGISIGGAGGYAQTKSSTNSASGGNGGIVSYNEITISGLSNISGDVYGGISQGGHKGVANFAHDGRGSYVNNNTITLIGDQITIGGSIFGGLSLNGDGLENPDPTYNSFYQGNTINIQSGHLTLHGEMRNFQNYNWFLPENEFHGDTIVTVSSTGSAVDINNTIHRVDVKATGNTLDGGDQVILISNVIGNPILKSRTYIEQGFFIVYDAEMVVENNGAAGNALVLNVLGAKGGGPDGKINPESEEFLKGRIAQLTIVDQAADMISDGISYARASLRKENANIFAIVDGGSSKYKNGGVSTLKLNDIKFAVGAAKAFELENKSAGMFAAFVEHGSGNYHSYNNFDYFGDIRASGKVRYNGAGLMFHMDVADTDVSKLKSKPNIFDDKYGLYVDAALRVGHVKADFHSADMVNGSGVEASYNTKSRYASAMAGVGYVWTLDEKQALDFYGRFNYSRLNEKDVQVVDEQMHAGAAHSKRLRLGARYGYAYSKTTTPYAGIAFERDFTGDVSGSAYGFTIKETSLKGNTGVVEAGVIIKPKGVDDRLSLHMGVQGYFGQRKGATAVVRARYVF